MNESPRRVLSCRMVGICWVMAIVCGCHTNHISNMSLVVYSRAVYYNDHAIYRHGVLLDGHLRTSDWRCRWCEDAKIWTIYNGGIKCCVSDRFILDLYIDLQSDLQYAIKYRLSSNWYNERQDEYKDHLSLPPRYQHYIARRCKRTIRSLYKDVRKLTPPFTIKFITKCAFRRHCRRQSARWLSKRYLYGTHSHTQLLPPVLCDIIQQYI